MNTTPDNIPEGYILDAQNRLVPIDQVKEVDMARHELVMELIKKAKELARATSQFKLQALDDVQAFVELSADKYNAKRGGRRGNVTLPSYDGRYRIVRAIADSIMFDERLQAAKALIDECLDRWSEGASPELKTIVHDAFATDKQGNLATHKILSLRRLNFEDDQWKQAMEAINDSICVTSSKSYVRFYERDAHGKYKQIQMDPTEL